jgi:type IV secretory pathway VirB9-like protein
MRVKAFLLAGTVLSLGACATGQELPAAPEVVTVAGPTVYQNVPVAVPTPFDLPADTKAPKVKANPVAATLQANKDGLVVPSPNDFIGAVYQPPYVRDFWYTLYTKAGDQTDIEFAEGETLKSMSCPDGGVVFTLNTSTFGPDDRPTYQVHVKAKRAGARMQCTFNTDLGPYRVNIIAGSSTKHVALRWLHDGPSVVQVAPSVRKNVASDFAVCGAGSDNGYKLSGDLAEWGLRHGDVSTDGRHTCITFPPEIGANGGPVVFTLDDQDNRRQANPTVIGRTYVIDGVQKRLELRMGAKSVLVEREG